MHVIQNMCNSRLFVLVEVYYLYSIGVFYLYGKEDVMPVTEKKYPDWVQKHRTKGTTVKKRGDSYYLYKRTSRRVKGKKYPQPVDTYIGVITPEGVIQSNKRKVDLTDAEYGNTDFQKPSGSCVRMIGKNRWGMTGRMYFPLFF